MKSFVPFVNGFMTLSENLINVLGYLPKDRFPTLHTNTAEWRKRLATLQIITGIAVFAIASFVDFFHQSSSSQKYLSLAQQGMALGLLYVNHGVFNFIRDRMEKEGFGGLTCAYDFYGRKFLPSLSLSCDVQNMFFEAIRYQLDRIHFITIFPPRFNIRGTV